MGLSPCKGGKFVSDGTHDRLHSFFSGFKQFESSFAVRSLKIETIQKQET